MRQEVLHQIHDGNQGIVKSRARARQAVWWPGLSVNISQLVENCSTCSQHRAEHREPLLTTPVPERPWQRVGTDLFFWEKTTYLLVVDYFSRYIEVAHLNVATANTVIAVLNDVFSRNGIPETVISDNGPQYSSALFTNFASDYGFMHITSSPRYPQANGEAERAVTTVKGLWKGGGEKTKALLAYPAMPLDNGYSPAQLLMGRVLRTMIPQLPNALTPQWPKIKGFRKVERRAKEKQQCWQVPCQYCSLGKACGCQERNHKEQSFVQLKHRGLTSYQGRSHGCARVCRCHPQWQLAHLKTDAELLFF